MDIGTEKPAIIVEPVEDPFADPTPVEAPEPAPVLEPVEARREGTAASGGARG